jgi:hypothetical protein
MIDLFIKKVSSGLTHLSNVRTLTKFFNGQSSSQILYFQIPVRELFSYVDLDIFHDVHNYIQAAEHIDLIKLDDQLDQGLQLKDIVSDKNYQEIRALMKLGYLIKDINQNGQLNPIQLILSSSPGKYLIHPGSVRFLVLAYILETPNLIDVIYCWDNTLDPTPIAFDYDFKKITNTNDFLSLFKQIKDNIVFRQTITQTSKLTKYSRLQSILLRKRLDQQPFSYDFLTLHDAWEISIEHLVRFKDIIQFESTEICLVSGVRFRKVNRFWTKE